MVKQVQDEDSTEKFSKREGKMKSPVAKMKATSKEIFEDPTSIKGLESAPQMGFLKERNLPRGMLGKRLASFAPILGTMIRMFREIKKSTKSIKKNPKKPKIKTDEQFIEKLVVYAKDLGVLIGFTKLRKELIFKDEAVLFDNVIVLSMEMDKEKMSKAPSSETQEMIIKTYNDLGIIAGKITSFLRENGYGAQSCHPLGGAISYPPLIGDAGMGWYGRHGLAIIPEYGPRHRIAAVLTSIDNLPKPTENTHKWIEEYCVTCGRCIEKCPVQAIFEIAINNKDETKTHINDDLCFPEFGANYGCSVCIKECMFNRIGYDKIKALVEQKKSQ